MSNPTSAQGALRNMYRIAMALGSGDDSDVDKLETIEILMRNSGFPNPDARHLSDEDYKLDAARNYLAMRDELLQVEAEATRLRNMAREVRDASAKLDGALHGSSHPDDVEETIHQASEDLTYALARLDRGTGR